MTLTERIAVLQRVADAIDDVRKALAPLSPEDRRIVQADLVASLNLPPAPAADGPPPGKPPARPKREPPGGPPPEPGERERALLRLLAAHPDGLRVNELIGRTGWEMPTVRHALRNSPLFEKADPDFLRSPWVLTAAGEQAAKALPTT